MGVDGEQVPAQLWVLVWRRQLRLAAEEEFWKGLSGEAVRYAVAPAPTIAKPLPEYLHRFLRDGLHLSDAEIEATSRDEAQRLLNEQYARELRDL